MIETLFETRTTPNHPAKYTDVLLGVFVRMLAGCQRVLDPFGGTGKIFLLNRWYPEMEIQAIELEPEWAAINPRTTIGNALALPFQAGYFDAVCTSPTYGNDMAIESNKEKWITEWKTFRYADMLGRKLNPDNSGKLKWGEKYRQFHIRAWQEATRVLQPGGVFVLNIKNHIRNGQEQFVTEWHIETILQLGYRLIEQQRVKTPSMRYGQNSEKRIEYESVIKFRKAEG